MWESRVSYPQDNYTITMAPRIAKGKAIIGVSGGGYPVRGFIAAFDAKTGTRARKFYTVPGPGDKDPGLIKAAKTWPKNIIGGGGGAYGTRSLTIPTWNWCTSVQVMRAVVRKIRASQRVRSSVCRLRGGRCQHRPLSVRHYQNVPGDEWDFDSVQHLLLADVSVKGVKRKVIMQANKNGFLYTLDRSNGKFISAKPIAKINWALGVDEGTGGRSSIRRPSTPRPNQRTSRRDRGAHNWSPLSYTPTLGLLYVSGQSGGGITSAVQPTFRYNPAGQNMGIVFGRGLAPIERGWRCGVDEADRAPAGAQLLRLRRVRTCLQVPSC